LLPRRWRFAAAFATPRALPPIFHAMLALLATLCSIFDEADEPFAPR